MIRKKIINYFAQLDISEFNQNPVLITDSAKLSLICRSIPELMDYQVQQTFYPLEELVLTNFRMVLNKHIVISNQHLKVLQISEIKQTEAFEFIIILQNCQIDELQIDQSQFKFAINNTIIGTIFLNRQKISSFKRQQSV